MNCVRGKLLAPEASEASPGVRAVPAAWRPICHSPAALLGTSHLTLWPLFPDSVARPASAPGFSKAGHRRCVLGRGKEGDVRALVPIFSASGVAGSASLGGRSYLWLPKRLLLASSRSDLFRAPKLGSV